MSKVAPGRTRRVYAEPNQCQATSYLLANAPKIPVAVRTREMLLTPAGKMLYTMRKATVEPVFKQIKEVRGLRRFRFRGLRRVECEWKLICATHNLLKLFRSRTNLMPV